MNVFKYFILSAIILIPYCAIAGQEIPIQGVTVLNHFQPDEEVYTYYDLRERKTYIQVTNIETENSDALPTLCIHVQIFQQDQSCDELNFEDELTPNDTVVYDMDNLVRNDGSPVPVDLDDDSYGFVAISAFECGDPNDDGVGNALLGNVRIQDDSGYEYRMNLISHQDVRALQSDSGEVFGDIIVPFNTVDNAKFADIVAFIVDEDRFGSGQTGNGDDYNVYNEETGISFDVFQVDENEERLSCDQKTFGCGPAVTLNYGINEDYANSRGGPLLCEGAGLLPGQVHGYISLENAFFRSPLDTEEDFEFICLYGLNNGNGTGSMDACQFKCESETNPECGF